MIKFNEIFILLNVEMIFLKEFFICLFVMVKYVSMYRILFYNMFIFRGLIIFIFCWWGVNVFKFLCDNVVCWVYVRVCGWGLMRGKFGV